nr:thioredoxin mitochondrial [Hymenolepis microstoma]
MADSHSWFLTMLVQKFFRLASRLPGSVAQRAISFSAVNFAKRTGITYVQNYDEFKEICTDNEATVIADFFASWCKPCMELGRRFDLIMEKYEDKVCLAKVDVDKVDELMSEYEIQATPTVIALKDGKEVGRFTGLKEIEVLEKFIKEHMN